MQNTAHYQKTRLKHHRLSTIQSKLTLIIALITTPVVILLSYLSFRNAQNLLSDQAFKQVESIISIKQDQLDVTVNMYRKEVELLSNTVSNIATKAAVSNANTQNDILDILTTAVVNNSTFDEIAIISPEGTVSASSRSGNSNQQHWESKAVLDKDTDVGIIENGTSLFVKRSVQLSFESSHYLIATMKLNAIQNIANDFTGLGKSGEVLLGKREGEEIILINKPTNASNAEYSNRIKIEENSRAPIVLATQGLSGTERTRDYRGVDVIATYGNPLVAGWGLVVKQDAEEVFAPLDQLRQELIGVSVLTLALFSLVAYLVSRTISEPLKKLQKGAEEIAKGKWDYQLNIDTGDEVERLAQEFRRMAVELSGLYGKLEQRVQVRTAELEKEKETSERLADDLKKFLQAVENASDQIIITDAKGIIIYANEAMVMNTGYTRVEVMGQNPGKNLWGGQMDEKYYNHMWTTIHKKRQKWQGEVTNKKKNGKTYIAALSISPILDVKGEVKYFVGIERDITKEKAVDRMKTEFISVASHQLRTPLSAVRWFAEMLISGDAGKLNKEQKEYVQQMYDSNDRMIELVNALLNVSRIEQGRITIEPEIIDLIKLIDQVIVELTPKIKEKKLHIIVSKHKQLPKISVDPKLVRQVYANLISNAVKYTPENGEIQIYISKKGDDVISQIQDNGVGIPEDQQGRVFNKFFRADNIRSVIPDGTGLGLYIVKSVVQSSGGKIWFESKEGKGTTFWFTLPLSGTPPKKGERTLEDAYL